MQGLIIENISNLYKIKTEKGIYEANARGKFKKEEITPVVGDKVEIQILDEENKKAVIEKIEPRTTYIKRPKMSNITQLILVVSSKNPKPDLLLLDKQLAFAEYLEIKPIIVLNKTDLDKKKEFEKIKEIYQNIGYTVIETIAKEQENNLSGIQELKKYLKGNINAFSGNSGVGKSTLINLLVGEKIAAIANKVQTTRTQIRGIVNRENSQIIFIDTPGIHKPKTKLNENMIELSWDAISNSDVILFLIEADSKEIGRGDMKILEKIRESKRKCILIINKMDLVNKEELAKLIDLYKNEYDFSAIIPISATKNKYKEVVLDEIEKNLKPGPAYYDQDEYTDQTLRQLAEETIREKALILLRDEVPHGIFVQVEKMKLKKTQKNEDIYNIEAIIYCLRNSHKGIIIGKNGEMLKRIGTMARKDMEQNFGTKVNLKTWVKVKEDWMNNEKFFNE